MASVAFRATWRISTLIIERRVQPGLINMVVASRRVKGIIDWKRLKWLSYQSDANCGAKYTAIHNNA